MEVKTDEIEILSPSSFCTYSVIENKQRTITQNQKIIDDKLTEVLKLLRWQVYGEEK